MRLRLAIVIAFCIASVFCAFASSKRVGIDSALRLRAGDTLYVEVTASSGGSSLPSGPGEPSAPQSDINSGDYLVARDGAIYGRTFGRIEVAGKTVAQAQFLIRKALKPFVNPEFVYVSLKSEASQFVFLLYESIGDDTATQPQTRGPVPYTPGMNLAEVLSTTTFKEPEMWEVTVDRAGKELFSQSLSKPVDSGINLEPNDLIILSPTQSIQVFISGFVPKAGKFRIQDGSSLGQVLSLAGGVVIDTIKPDISMSDLRAAIFRNGTTLYVPLSNESKLSSFKLNDGDQISIVASPVVHFSVLGNVQTPGEFQLRGKIDIYRALASAGGISASGSMHKIWVYRQNSIYNIDASGPESGQDRPDFDVQNGDLVFAETNRNIFYVLGSVQKPGQFFMEDNKVYHLTDILSLAGGLTEQGVLRRVFVSHPQNGKRAKITEYNLDEYLRDGKDDQNPVIHPGDAVLFTNTKGISIQAAGSILSIGVLLDTLIRNP